MPNKKVNFVDINKEENKIILERQPSVWLSFLKKYNKLFLAILAIITLSVSVTSFILLMSSVDTSEKVVIKEVSIDTDLNIGTADVTANSYVVMTDETAKKAFKNNAVFKTEGVVLLVKTVSKKQYTIYFYSDYTAVKVMKNSNIVTRINPVDGDYGIKENGVINSKAKISDVVITGTKQYDFGKVIYYSDGSAMIDSDDNNDIFVRDANDIKENYITNNKVSYVKKRDIVGSNKLIYYHDGTVEVINGNKSYLVRDFNNLNITKDNVSFKYNNEARVINSVKLDKGVRIDYYSDGGAVIYHGNDRLSVRKSNSIVIKDNKLFEIVDNIYVVVSDTKNNGNVIYYTNGSAVIKNYNGKTVYVPESGNIKYQNGRVISVGEDYEELTNDRNLDGDKITTFETVSIVETGKYIAIVPKNSVLYNADGSLKEILVDNGDAGNKPITITNNTNDTIKYRFVLEESKRTTLKADYIKYQLMVGSSYIEPKILNHNVWMKDEISDSLVIQGKNYILVERTLEPQQTDEIRVMFWVDYNSVPNSMQNKYFYGTLRLYAWQEIKIGV